MIVQVIVCVSSTFFANQFKSSIFYGFPCIIPSVDNELIFMEEEFQIDFDIFRIFEIIDMIYPIFLALCILLNYTIFYVRI